MVWRCVCLLVALPVMASGCADDTTIPFGQSQPDQADTGDAGVEAETDEGTDADAGAVDPGGEPDSPPDLAIEDAAAPDADDADSTDAADAADTLADAPDGDAAAEPGPVVRFVAFGDWGSGVTAIARAADAMRAHCQIAGCDFVIGLGDNFYDDGVTGLDDPQWQDKFEEPFADWDIPFYMSLGNHDYRGDVDAQIDYTEVSDKWTMPARYFDVVASPVHFFALDTNEGYSAQGDWLGAAIPDAEEPWVIAFGHHPWRSNGHYGDQTGVRRSLFEWALCDRADFYLCGHEHDMQHLTPDCGVEFVISGAMAYTRDVGSGPNTLFSSDELGFAWLEVSEDVAIVEFHDFEGNRLHRSERARRDRTPVCEADDYCAAGCTGDPDCAGLSCGADDSCEPLCAGDPDCYLACPCDFNYGICEPFEDPSLVRCACDPQCRGGGRPCMADDHCDTWCPEGIDPDCG